MTHSMELNEPQLTKRIGSPLNWLRIVWSIWFDAPWYQANIHPRLKNAAEAKWLLFQTVLGTMLISVIALLGTWLVGQLIERIAPVYSGYMDFNILVIMLCPILFGGAGALGIRARDKTLAGGIPLAASAAVLGLAYFISMCTALAVLLIVPVNPQAYSSPFLAQWKMSLIFIFPYFMTFPGLTGLVGIDQAPKSGPREAKFLGILQKRSLRIIIGMGWMIMWALQGATAILSDWRYYPESFGNLLLIIGLTGAVFAFLYAMSILAWHRQVRAQHGVQPTRPAAEVEHPF
jgi:hypothetical protein